MISITSESFIKIGVCHFGFHGAFGVITKAFKVCGRIGQPRELLYQVDPAGVQTIIPSHSMFIACLFERAISSEIIFPFPALISISFTAIAFLVIPLLSISTSIRGYFLSTYDIFGCITSFELSKNHLCQKFIPKNGRFFL